MSGKRVLLYVQHLLGIGHLKRAATIGRAMADFGMQVTLVSGGVPVSGVSLAGLEYIQLPPASSDPGFKDLLDVQGVPVDDTWKQRRRELLLSAFAKTQPHAVVCELFPFGRRQMRFEVLPLLEEAVNAPRRPLIISSVRDVLGGGQKNPARQDEMLEVFERYFDYLMVHGDPEIIPFGRTFRHSDQIADRLYYTGYVVDQRTPARSGAETPGIGANEVVVSAGGGAVGYGLLETAMRCRSLSSLADRTWRILAGVNLEDSEFGRLEQLRDSLGDDRLILERSRDDFALLLQNCAVSVSQGGYNTMMETLQACARAVVVPFAGGAETEQALRADLLAERGLIETVEESLLSPESLAAAIDRTASRPRGEGGAIDLGGAPRTADLVSMWTAALEW